MICALVNECCFLQVHIEEWENISHLFISWFVDLLFLICSFFHCNECSEGRDGEMRFLVMR